MLLLQLCNGKQVLGRRITGKQRFAFVEHQRRQMTQTRVYAVKRAEQKKVAFENLTKHAPSVALAHEPASVG